MKIASPLNMRLVSNPALSHLSRVKKIGALNVLSHTLASINSDCASHVSSAYGDSDTVVHLNLLPLETKNGSESTSCYMLNKFISSCAKSADLDMGIQLHSNVIKLGFTSNVYICSALVDLYGKCLEISSAQKLFDEMPQRNTVTWNSLISGYLQVICPERAIDLFLRMTRQGTMPTPFGVSAVLLGCSQLRRSKIGAQVHGLSLKYGFDLDLIVGTGLIDMYAKCSEIEESRRAFDQMPERNFITWTTIITGYSQNNSPHEALILFIDMRRLDIESNYLTYNSLLSSFSGRNHLYHCKQIHCHIVRAGIESNRYLQVSLMTVYSECGCSHEDFHQLCLNVNNWDQISWNAVIAGLSHLGFGKEALDYFSNMRSEGISCDSFTLTSALKSIGIISALESGKQIHALAFKGGYSTNVLVQNGLVSMYSRCGSLNEAKLVFSFMSQHDVISWNSLISGCAHHGYGSEVIKLFEQMKKSGVQPDDNTFLSVFSACSHVGFVEKGLEVFGLMKEIYPSESLRTEHYASIVDLFARAGHLHEAEALINGMPINPGPSIYKSLLSGCRIHGNMKIAERVSKKLIELYPKDPATYVLMSSSFAIEACWDEAAGVRKLIQERRMLKNPAYSWIMSSKHGGNATNR